MVPCRRCTAIVILALLAVGSSSASAQEGTGDWQTIASGDEIISLAIDPRDANRLLAGTEGGGLVVWNVAARTFEQYLFPTQAELRSNVILDIALTRDGAMWLATDQGVTVARGSVWRSYGPTDGLPTSRIQAIAVQADGTVWAGARSHGLAVLDPGASSWRRVRANSLQPTAGPGIDRVADLMVEQRSDRLWVAHGRGRGGPQPAVSIYDPATDRWQHVWADADPTKGPPSDQVMALAQSEDGAVWLATWAKGVVRYDGQRWQAYDETDGLCGRSVWAIAAGDGQLWAACGSDSGGEGVARWSRGAWSVVGRDDDRLRHVVAVAIASGTAYLGTNGPGDLGRGIVPFASEPLPELTTAPETPFANDITAIAFDGRGMVWVGTRGAGLMSFDGARWRQFTQESTAGLLVGDTITDLAVRQGQLWVAVTKTGAATPSWSDGGVSILNLVGETWEDPLPLAQPGMCDGLPDREVSSLAIGPDPHEQVWIGLGIASGGPGYSRATHQGNGLVSYDPVDDRWECYTYESTGSGAGLAGNTVLDLVWEGQDLWIATSYHATSADQRRRGGGVSELRQGHWTSWEDDDEGLKTYSQSGDRDPIRGDFRSAGTDGRGGVWMGTWDLDVGELTNVWPYVDAVVNERSGAVWLPHIFSGAGWVSAIAADRHGQLWVGTTRGHASTRHDVEYSPAGGEALDTAEGGVWIWNGSRWSHLLAADSGSTAGAASGLASKAITALALDPHSGAMWVGTENGGISVYGGQNASAPTRTPAPDSTATPVLTAAATFPVVMTIPAPTICPDCPTPTARPRPTDPPEMAPPPEVPEAGTLLLLAGGLAGLAAWLRRRGG